MKSSNNSAFAYLNWLKDQCRLARMAHERELNDLKQHQQPSGQQQKQKQVQMTVNNKKVKEPSRAEQMQAVVASLQTIDLIECLRVRVEEILNE